MMGICFNNFDYEFHFEKYEYYVVSYLSDSLFIEVTCRNGAIKSCFNSRFVTGDFGVIADESIMF